MPSNSDSYIVAAPPRPTSFIGRSTAVLSDLTLVIGIIFALALTPIVVVRIIAFVADLITGR
jgi:hypothetical protein